MKKPITYRDAGVDIDKADRLVEFIRPLAQSTFRSEVETDIGGFGGIVSIDPTRFPHPMLVASTDGVGTKLRLAFNTNRHDTVGIDLVAMCANDVIVQGAEPLFFLDYFATGRLEPDTAREVLRGVAEGCRMAGCALIGGETAEMPSFYPDGEYELAGFCVGVLNRGQVIDGRGIRPGDALIGLASSGLHSNGFSLVRKIFTEENGYRLDQPAEGLSAPLGEELLRPTRIYVRPVLGLLGRFTVKGIAHITGGGLTENIPRVLPEDCSALLDPRTWPRQPIFDLIQREASLDAGEMLRTFNCGIGMVLVTAPEQTEAVRTALHDTGETTHVVGEVRPRADGGERVAYGQ